MVKYLRLFLKNIILVLFLGVLIFAGMTSENNKIFAQMPIIEPAPSTTPLPTPTSPIPITGTPIAAPTPEIIATSPVMAPVTPIVTIGLFPTTAFFPSPIIVNPSPNLTIAPTSYPISTPATYWVSLGLNGIPADQINTAEKLLDYLSSFGTEAVKIDRWYNGGWDSHLNNLPFNNFPIEVGKGYEITFKGKPDPFFLAYQGPFPSPLTITYNIYADWNLLSIPEAPFTSFIAPATAESICNSINSQGGAAVEIDYHDIIPAPLVWYKHICGTDENNFPVRSGYGYFIKAITNSSWTLNPVTPTPTPNKVSFGTPQVSLDADDFYIIANGIKFAPRSEDVTVHSDPGTADYTTLELTWSENGVEMRMYIYFKSDGTNWWSEEVRTYNGNNPCDWIYYYPGKIFESKLGETFYAPTFDLSSNPNGQIHFKNLNIRSFANYVMPTATPTITPTPTVVIVTLSPTPTVESIPSPTATSTPAPREIPLPTTIPTLRPQKGKPFVITYRFIAKQNVCDMLKVRNLQPKFPLVNLEDVLKCADSNNQTKFNPFVYYIGKK